MQTYLDCYPCFLRQALSAARRAGANEEQQFTVIQEVLKILSKIQLALTPPEIAILVHKIVRDKVGASDPYREAKVESTQKALALYPRLKALVNQSDDPLEMALRISIAGNIIDFGVWDEIQDLDTVVNRVINQSLFINDIAPLKERLSNVDQVLFLGDNAGETVFDRVLIETLPVPVIYAVKGGPIINDATMEDALAAGLGTCATLISNGADAPGTILSLCSDEFRKTFDTATLIIAKGQANYETLSEAGERVFCLLQVKCPVIATDIKGPVDSIVIRQSTS